MEAEVTSKVNAAKWNATQGGPQSDLDNAQSYACGLMDRYENQYPGAIKGVRAATFPAVLLLRANRFPENLFNQYARTVTPGNT